MADKQRQQIEFLPGQLHWCAVERHRARGKFDAQALGLEDGVLPSGGRTAELGAQARDQLAKVASRCMLEIDLARSPAG